MQAMEVINMIVAFFSSAAKSVEVKICGVTILTGLAFEQTGVSNSMDFHSSIYYAMETIATFGKMIVYGGGAIAFIYKGLVGVNDWWNKRKQ